jgi:hypothetical protein
LGFMEFEGADPAAVVRDHMLVVEHVLATLPPKSSLEMLSFVRSRVDAVEARIVADRYEAGASDRGVEELLRKDGKTSKSAAKVRARRGKATNANSEIADRMAAGSLSAEQADVIADAAEETDGEAACDSELIDQIASTTPEQGKKKATEYVNSRKDASGVQTRHDRQKRPRGWYRHRLSNGNSALTLHGDGESIDEIERNIRAQADTEYRTDGGRDVLSAKHPRTSDQRGFDGAKKLICDRSKDPEGSKGARPRSNRRTTVFLKATVDQVTGTGSTLFRTVDGKPLPVTVVEELACGSDFIAQIFSVHGELLWQGRKTRLATPAQINGLISRDGGCVLCGSHHDRCVAHHLLPWDAPAKGDTNIDLLAFVCEDCHPRIHQQKLTLYYDRTTQTWKLRAATWEEIPPCNGPAPPKPSDKHQAYRRPPVAVSSRKEAETSRPFLHERRQNARRHDPHGDRLF